ncbi:NAD(+) diphosphatase [Nocardioides fonticola]|uniref:NAD(+) diphosphatase n=1 Tax=Nocardioides fonticola TaxID=450363 RepID=A0ABP7XAH5_9ACTN
MSLPDRFAHEVLADDPHDRSAHRRRDDAWLEERWADAATRVLVMAGPRVRPVSGEIAWVSPQEAPAGVRVFLGEQRDRAWFAVVADDPAALIGDDERAWMPLRGVLPLLAGEGSAEAPLVFHAFGIAEWLSATVHCPRCGGRLEARAAGHELVCLDCGRPQFPRTDPAVIMIVTAGEPGTPEERCLLGRQSVWPAGWFSTLAGFCEPGETLEDAVRREVAEETGVRVGEVEYFGNQPWPLPASLMLGFVGRASSEQIDVDRDEIEEARWFTRAQLREQAEAGEVRLPGGVSISRALIEHWYGGPLPGEWR